MLNKTEQQKIKKVLSKVVRVDNMQSSGGNTIPNQFIISGSDFKLFQSYSSPIALIYNGVTYIFKDYDCSKTTGKYRNQFLNSTLKEINAKLKDGVYIAVDFEVTQ